MNWLLIVTLIVLLFFVLHGYYKGFIRIIFSLISIILVITFVAWATPYVSTFLEKNTPLYTSIQQKCETHIHEKVEENADAAAAGEIQNSADVLVIAGITLPASIQQQLIGQGVAAADDLLEESGIYTEAANAMAGFIVRGIAFLLALAAALIVTGIIAGLLNLFAKLPIIRGINRFFGLFAGLLQGLVLVWIFMYIVAVCCTSEFGENMISLIHQSWFLSYLYNNNGVMQFTSIFF